MLPKCSRTQTMDQTLTQTFTGKALLKEPIAVSTSGSVKPFHAMADHIRSRLLLAVIVRQKRSEEHTSELQSLMRISYAVFCLKKKKHIKIPLHITQQLIQTNYTYTHLTTHIQIT